MQQQWHFIIPFYYGVNRYVTGRGGAPVNNKLSYLSQTIAAICERFDGADVIVTVCDTPSEHAASKVSLPCTVTRIDCAPLHLPYATVKYAAQKLGPGWNPADIFVFNEDDQIIYLTDVIKKDIEEHGSRHFFSPHRWVKGGKGRRYRKAPRYCLREEKGIIDNVYPDAIGAACTYTASYRTQKTRLSAYAACWATHCSSLTQIRFTPYETNPESICLETASFLLLDTPLTVLKPDLANQAADDFIVDHLSGNDYFSRRFSLKRLLNHIKKMKF